MKMHLTDEILRYAAIGLIEENVPVNPEDLASIRRRKIYTKAVDQVLRLLGVDIYPLRLVEPFHEPEEKK